MNDDERQIRQEIIDNCINMNSTGLNQGTSGNISVRHGEHMLITPSAIPYEEMTPESITAMPISTEDGVYGSWTGPYKPSTEWCFHLDIMIARPEVNSVVHTHSTYSTILAIARKPIPACHYMIAAFGGSDVRCSGYARYGTKELSDLALAALEDRQCCLMANHGLIALGNNLRKAMWVAVELETIARQYYHSLLIGGPVVLSDAQIEETAKGFSSYGLQDKDANSEQVA